MIRCSQARLISFFVFQSFARAFALVALFGPERIHCHLVTDHPYVSADRAKPQLLYAAMDGCATDLIKLLDLGIDTEGKGIVRDPRL